MFGFFILGIDLDWICLRRNCNYLRDEQKQKFFVWILRSKKKLQKSQKIVLICYKLLTFHNYNIKVENFFPTNQFQENSLNSKWNPSSAHNQFSSGLKNLVQGQHWPKSPFSEHTWIFIFGLTSNSTWTWFPHFTGFGHFF